MSIKLTIDLDQKVFEQAEAYANQSGQSLSHLISTYLTHLSQLSAGEAQEEGLPPEFEGLFGVIDLSAEIDDKALIRSMMYEKHRS